MDKHIKKFIHTLQLLISAPLFGCYYADIKDLLDEARNIEDMIKDIVVNIPKQKKFAILKLNRGLKRSAELARSATRSTNTKKALRELIRVPYI